MKHNSDGIVVQEVCTCPDPKGMIDHYSIEHCVNLHDTLFVSVLLFTVFMALDTFTVSLVSFYFCCVCVCATKCWRKGGMNCVHSSFLYH